MKKLTFFLAIIVSVGLLSSCEKNKTADISMDAFDITKLKSRDILVSIESSPKSGELNVTPYLIPGANNGGNRTCDEVAIAFDAEFVMCGDKIDFDAGAFMGDFPDGLEVSTDGTYVSFDIADCVEIGGEFYKVGAVIVKGSNKANVYYYPDGALFDYGLAAPLNFSARPAGLSNLTFCFVPCEPQEPAEFIIALKSYITWDNGGDVINKFAVSGGTVYPNEELSIGYNNYVAGVPATYPLYRSYSTEEIGEIHVVDFMDNGIHYLQLEVVISSADDWYLTESDLYVGSLTGLEAYLHDYVSDPGKLIFQYYFFPFNVEAVSKTHLFLIDFADIDE